MNQVIIDTHVHFWNYDPQRDAWIDESMQLLQRDFGVEDVLKASGGRVEGFIAIQADQSRAETEFLLSLAEKHTEVKGVIGWLDLRSDHLTKELDYYAQYPALRGLRHIVQAEPLGFMREPVFQRGIQQLERYGLVYEILVYAPQLEDAVHLVQQFPQQLFVLDHIGKPDIKNGKLEAWKRSYQQLSQLENCYCKLSGMVTEAAWQQWSEAELKPYLDVALECFGAERLMFGSDWPVCQLAATYEEVQSIVTNYICQLSTTEQAMILHQNARQFYKLI